MADTILSAIMPLDIPLDIRIRALATLVYGAHGSWDPAPLVLLCAVNRVQVLFDVRRRGGKLELLVKFWHRLPLQFFHHSPDDADDDYACVQVIMGKFMRIMTVLEVFGTPATLCETDVERMLETFVGRNDHTRQSVESHKLARSRQWDQLLQSLRTPKTLKNLSRLAIRESLAGQHLDRVVRRLNIPEGLPDFLVFVGENPARDFE